MSAELLVKVLTSHQSWVSNSRRDGTRPATPASIFLIPLALDLPISKERKETP